MKRTLDDFFKPPAKKLHVLEKSANEDEKTPIETNQVEYSKHATYPFSILEFAASDFESTTPTNSIPHAPGKVMNDQPDLDLLYFKPYIPKNLERQFFEFLRRELPFYRVEYKIKRGGMETQVRTPRYTTVFGLDSTCTFDEGGQVADTKTGKRVERDPHYMKYPPRPIPKCLDNLRKSAEASCDCSFNFCLVNYYASGADSIAFHSDDERFLGPDPGIASFSFGARRDFVMKHKPIAPSNKGPSPATKPITLPLGSGDMILMRGKTQANWLHSIPKRTGKNADDGGRINITFRKALMRAGTENYYNYNVGTGPVYKWDEAVSEMRLWKA